MRSRLAVVLAAASLGTLSLLSPAEASHGWNNYHWARTASSFTLKVGNNVTGTWTAPFGTALQDWSTSSVLDLTEVTGTANKRCSAVSGTVQVCNGKYGQNGWLGLASINISGSHITQGTAKMNDSYFSLATYDNPNEKLHVMCQEIGHTFGLGHTSEDGSSQNTCMDYFSNTGANAGSTLSTHPNAHDYDQLVATYAHVDATTTVGSSSASSPSVGDDRSTWGREASRTADGSESTFVRDLGGGNAVVTHVTWALAR